MRDDLGLAVFLPERDLYERAEAKVAAAIGADAFESLRAAGRSLTPAEYAANAQTTLAAIVAQQLVAQPPPLPRGDPAEPELGLGLTRRETEVLHLLTEGLTNAQLAERLSISPSTVGSHLERIFAKPDVTTRGAAVAAAHWHGLA